MKVTAPHTSSDASSLDFLIVTPLRILPLPLVPPLGPLSLYSYARRQGFNGELLNFNEIITASNVDEHDEIVHRSLQNWLQQHPEACCICISILFSGVFQRALTIAREVKRLRPDIPTVVGGIHPTLHCREILENCPEIDFVVMGEGETQFVDLLHHLKKTGKAGYELKNGIGYRKNGIPIILNKSSYTNAASLEELGSIDYRPIDFAKYHTPDMDTWYNPRGHHIIAAAPLITSRSCPYSCNFCSIHAVHGPRSTYRFRAAEHVLEELKFLYYERQIRYFYIVDDCATCNKKKALELYKKIADSGMKISIEFQNGLNLRSLDDEVIDAIVAAGMIRGGLAIESGSETIRNQVIGKGLTEERILAVYNRFRQKHPHVWLVGFFILGLPEETEQTLQETANLIDKLEDLYPVFNAAVPTPGTRLWDQCVRDGLLLFDSSNAWQKSFVFGRKKDDTDNLCWTMKGLESIPQTFVIQPYRLSLDILHERYRTFQELGVQRLKAIKSKLSSCSLVA